MNNNFGKIMAKPKKHYYFNIEKGDISNIVRNCFIFQAGPKHT